MGFYSRSITIAANTLEANAVETVIDLSHGVITRVIFRPRPGHASLLHVRVFHRRHQIFPENADDDLHGDTFPLEWTEWYEMFEKPFTLTIFAWNEDDTYPHRFDIAFATLPKYAALPYALAKAFSEWISSLSPKRISIPTWLGGKKG